VVVFHPFDSDRLKRTVADVEGDLGGFDAARGASLEKRRREVQTCCGCGDGTPLAREHRLITLGVEAVLFVAFYVWRQRCAANAIDDLVKVAIGFEANHAAARLAPVENFGGEFAPRELDPRAGQQSLPRANKRFPNKRLDSADEKDLYAPAEYRCASGGHADPPADQPGGKDAGVIQNKQITGTEMLGQLCEYRIGELAGCAIDYQQS
jgi:hypothetical protein